MKVLYSAEDIAGKVQEIATEINRLCPERPLILLGVLKGSLHFVSDLARALEGDVRIDFIQPKSYEGTKTSGIVQLKKDHDVNIEGKDVIIVEDIVDTGLTLTYLVELLSTRRPKSLRVASLLRKPDAAIHPAQIDFVGFDIANEFVVGYGLDHDERYRSLPFIAVLQSSDQTDS